MEKRHYRCDLTAPINKRSLELGGFEYPGHTEFIAALTGTNRVCDEFFCRQIACCSALNAPFADPSDRAGENRSTGQADRIYRPFSFVAPRTKGEDRRCRCKSTRFRKWNVRQRGTRARSNRPCDRVSKTVSTCPGRIRRTRFFLRGYKGEFDAVIACYHDQATIAVKSLVIRNGGKCYTWIALIRTSVDHGTAFDIAGKGCRRVEYENRDRLARRSISRDRVTANYLDLDTVNDRFQN